MWADQQGERECLFEPPTNDFLRWDGILFDPKRYRGDTGWDFQKQKPVNDVEYTPSTTWNTPPFPTSDTLKAQTVNHVGDIESGSSVNGVVHISSLTTTRESAARPPTSSPRLSERSKTGEKQNRHFRRAHHAARQDDR
jgi:hypothetical protein